jgi:hypothetical protein
MNFDETVGGLVKGMECAIGRLVPNDMPEEAQADLMVKLFTAVGNTLVSRGSVVALGPEGGMSPENVADAMSIGLSVLGGSMQIVVVGAPPKAERH